MRIFPCCRPGEPVSDLSGNSPVFLPFSGTARPSETSMPVLTELPVPGWHVHVCFFTGLPFDWSLLPQNSAAVSDILNIFSDDALCSAYFPAADLQKRSIRQSFLPAFRSFLHKSVTADIPKCTVHYEQSHFRRLMKRKYFPSGNWRISSLSYAIPHAARRRRTPAIIPTSSLSHNTI